MASVDDSGKVTPVAVGSATIAATTEDGGFTATCNVTVSQKVSGVKLDKASLSIVGAGSDALKATVEPDNATNKNVTWSSSNEAVATVDGNGVVTSVGKGTATITVSTEDGQFSDSCSVTVTNPATGIVLSSGSLNLTKCGNATLSAELSGALAGSTDDATIAWESSDPSVATVSDDGVVTAVKTGQAVITAKVAEGVSDRCLVSVTNPATSVVLSETKKAATVGDAGFQLTASVAPADADETTVTWASSNSSVVAVDSSGNVTIVAAGQAVISATVGDASAQCVVVVSAKEVAATSSTSGFAASASATDSETAGKIAALEEENGSLSLIVQAIDGMTQPVKEALEALSAAGSMVAETFDIHFADNQGNEIEIKQGDGMTITVKVKMTDAMRALDPGTLKVCYVADDGTVEEMPTWVEGDLLCFITTHFSNYAVVGQPLSAGDDSGQTPIPLAKGDGSSLASTGDSAAPLAAVVVAFAAFVLLMVSRRLRQS